MNNSSVLAGVAQWIEHQPADQKVASDSQSGHMPGLWARSPVGGVREATNQRISCTLMFLSPCLLLPLPISLKKINK